MINNEQKNPYKLIWYSSKLSKKKIAKNNAKFWNWELQYGLLSNPK